MIKFVYKKSVGEKSDGKIVIFYNALDIFLGTTLMLLVVFFIHDYLVNARNSWDNGKMFINQPLTNTVKLDSLKIKP